MTDPLRRHGLAPVSSSQTQLLVLGSFPGAPWLVRQQYYAHPQNTFCKIFQAILPSSPYAIKVDSYEKRIAALRSQGLGLWDVYTSCEREGSLDSAIEHPQVNDLAGLAKRCPALRVIAHHRGKSFRQARHTRRPGLPVVRLPATSPANARWSLRTMQLQQGFGLQKGLPVTRVDGALAVLAANARVVTKLGVQHQVSEAGIGLGQHTFAQV